MKREYPFTISRKDRICLVLFIAILLSWEFIKYFVPEISFGELRTEQTLTTEIAENKPITAAHRGKYKSEKRKESSAPKTSIEKTPTSKAQPTEIMEAALEDLIAIGFEKNVAHNILKYKSAGGQFRDSTDILKIYGMDSEQWNKVSSFVIFPKQSKQSEFKPYTPNRYLPKRIIDLNTATEIDLDSLPGIGSVLANRIINFRNSLGGFYDVEQIRSCYGIPSETIDKILPMVAVIEPIQPKNVNQINWKDFHHPYLNKKYIPMIIAYKTNHGSFRSLQDFRKVFPPDSTWCNGLIPYLTFGGSEEENQEN